MRKRPRLDIKPNAKERTTETICWVALVLFLSFTVYAYNVLPDTIPTHFNGKGNVDATGDKATFWIMPIMAVFTFLLLTVFNRFPHTFNYMVEITEDNAEFQYRTAMQMMRVLKLMMVILFFLISITIFLTAKGVINGGGIPMIIIALSLPVIPIIYYFVKMKRGH